MSRKPREFRDLHRNQLSMILVGIAIAGSGDRKKLFSKLSLKSIASDRVKRCLQAIVDGDVEGVRGFLLSLGVAYDGSPALDAIVDRLHEIHAQEALEDTMRCLMAGDVIEDLGTAEKRLEAALQTVRNAKEQTFKPTTTKEDS